MLIWGLAILDILAFGGVAAALGWKLYTTRDRGFLWLIVAVVVWPITQIGLSLAYGLWVDTIPEIGTLAPGEIVSGALYIFDLVQRSLLIVAILMLYRGSTSLKPKTDVTTVSLEPSPEPST
jgi:nitrate reductase NapE component